MLIFFTSREMEHQEALGQKQTSLDFLKKLFGYCAEKGVVGRNKVSLFLYFILPHSPLILCLDFSQLSVLRGKENSRPKKFRSFTSRNLIRIHKARRGCRPHYRKCALNFPHLENNRGQAHLETSIIVSYWRTHVCERNLSPARQGSESFNAFSDTNHFQSRVYISFKKETFVQTLSMGLVQANSYPCYFSHLHTLYALGGYYFALPSFPNVLDSLVQNPLNSQIHNNT